MRIFNLTRIKNNFHDNSLLNVQEEVHKELIHIPEFIKPGSSIAIGVGSRGIDNLNVVVKEVVEYVKQAGGHPFIIPAMGSHGGATSTGQKELLESYGISEKTVGAPVRSSMEVVELPKGNCINSIYMDKASWQSDGVILINKIKPHSDFHANYESGLTKMAVIGLGKEKGAEAIHHYGVYGLTQLIPLSAKEILSTGKILAGIALVENAYGRLMMVKAIIGADIMEAEPKLLDIARANMPRLPVDHLDVLIIDQMGKNISGVGIDTNIIGRLKIYGQTEPDKPDIRSIIVTDLTAESHGNATGVGLADIITRRLYDKIDFDATYKNIITSSFLERAKIPIVAQNDSEALDLALRNCGTILPGKERIIRIKDTLHLGEIYVSEAILNEINNKKEIELMDIHVNLFNEENEFSAF